jgi:hypothetical protein
MNSQNPNNEFRATALFTGTTNCEDEQECEITSSIFTETGKPLFKVKTCYTFFACEEDKKYLFYIGKRESTSYRTYKKTWKLFSLPKRLNLLTI